MPHLFLVDKNYRDSRRYLNVDHVFLIESQSLWRCVAPTRLIPEQETKHQASEFLYRKSDFTDYKSMLWVPEKRKCLSVTWANFILALGSFTGTFWKIEGFHQPKIMQGNIKCLLIILWWGWRCWRLSASVSVYSLWTDAQLLPQTKLWFLPVILIHCFLLTENTSCWWLHRICLPWFKSDAIRSLFSVCDLI